MTRNRTLLALLAIQMLALGAFAQSTSEFGRASGGTIEALAKGSRKTSGSLGLTHATLGGQGYEATLGGELLSDRIWFFGAGSVLPRTRFSSDLRAIDGKATAQPVDWTSVTASFTRMQQPLFAPDPRRNDALSSSFLSLRSTSVLSDRMSLNFSFSQQSGTRTTPGLMPLDAR